MRLRSWPAYHYHRRRLEEVERRRQVHAAELDAAALAVARGLSNDEIVRARISVSAGDLERIRALARE
jgi:hypothetical protein